VILPQALRAGDLAGRFGVAADVWSVTSYQQLPTSVVVRALELAASG
jgi:pyruvate dehydrogenase complex dehydrogenase (E1) component